MSFNEENKNKEVIVEETVTTEEVNTEAKTEDAPAPVEAETTTPVASEDSEKDLPEEIKEDKTEDVPAPIEAETTTPVASEDSEINLPEVEKEAPKAKKEAPITATAVPTEFLPENFNPFEIQRNPKFQRRQTESAFEERLINVKRVIKTTKGGRRFKFSALMIIGDKKGKVGYATAKSIEVPEAIKKASRLAKKNIYIVPVVGSNATVPHVIIGKHGASRVLLKPAPEGKGIIASDNVRAVVELAGYRNIYSKNLGSNNPQNVVHATVNGLINLKTKEQFEKLRGKDI
jgi:small subunit ribosomal protein S5